MLSALLETLQMAYIEGGDMDVAIGDAGGLIEVPIGQVELRQENAPARVVVCP